MALDWLILMGLYTCTFDGYLEHLEYTASKGVIMPSAGWALGNNIYRTWYCLVVANALIKHCPQL